MYCAGLCCLSALCMALHCFPIILEKLSDKDPVPAPERRLMVIWIRDAWEQISDEKIQRATKTAHFPKGMKLSELEDTMTHTR